MGFHSWVIEGSFYTEFSEWCRIDRIFVDDETFLIIAAVAGLAALAEEHGNYGTV